MNYILGGINKNIFPEKDAIPGFFRSEDFFCEIDRINALKTQGLFYYDEKNGVACGMIGYALNLKELCLGKKHRTDVECIAELFVLEGEKMINKLDGIFTIVIVDTKIKKTFIFQDEFNSFLPLYYTKSKRGIYFSTNLKKILKTSGVKRSLDDEAAEDFLSNRFIIPSGKTLIKNVYKLTTGRYLEINWGENDFSVRKINFIKNKSNNKDNFEIGLKKRLKKIRKELICDKINCTLSSGFDTNFVLNILKDFHDGEIRTFTVGGKKINEIPSAAKISESYSNVENFSGIVSGNILDKFPEIVWRTEGYVCELGIFLQYRLAKILKENEASLVILSEGADQQVDKCYDQVYRMKDVIKRSFFGDFIYKVLNKSGKSKLLKLYQKFHKKEAKKEIRTTLDYILKKSGIMLNSFNIQGVYPFLNRDTGLVAERLGIRNVEKRVYKKEVVAKLGSERSSLLKKIGGSTDVEFIINDNVEAINEILDSALIKRFIDEDTLREIAVNPTLYAEFILQLCYIFTFNKLFIENESLIFNKKKFNELLR